MPSAEFQILRNVATYFSLVAPERRADMLCDLIRIIKPPPELLRAIANELPPTPEPQPPPQEEPEPRRVTVGTIYYQAPR
jgi:hypothetical protein